MRKALSPRVFLALAVAIYVLGAGCAALQPGADAVLVRAEQTERLGFGIVDTFVRLERQNPQFQAVIGEKGHAVAESIRREFPDVLRRFREAQMVYAANRNAENKATLETALKLVEKAIADAQFFLAKWGA